MAPSRLEEAALPSPFPKKNTGYSCLSETQRIFQDLLLDESLSLPSAVLQHAQDVFFASTTGLDSPPFPNPFKQTENVASLKAIECSIAAALADERYGARSRKISIDIDKAARFLMSAYICTIDGKNKLHPKAKAGLKNTDLLKAQSNIYRRFSSNLYATRRPGEYYHLHGSLEATTALQMIGLPAFNPEITDYRQAIDHIEHEMQKFTVEELEERNQQKSQAGVQALKREEFLKMEYGQEILREPLWRVDCLESSTPPSAFDNAANLKDAKRILSGIKVLEMCRVIAGPSIARILTEYGADVLKVTSPNLSDVPWFQVEGNMGKHTTDLDLKSPEGRAQFDKLLAEADVLVDGYRHGALERLGYGVKAIERLAKKRGKGIVYVSENCFGYGKWDSRPGWQQIADCVSGVAWEQGRFMGLDEPIVPPFPMSDYGTGLLGAIAALLGLYKRTTVGGSYHAKVCLVQYDNLLFRLGKYPEQVQDQLRKQFAGPYFDLRHHDHTDVFSGACLETMKKVIPELFEKEEDFTETWWSEGYKANIKVVRPVADIEGIDVGYERGGRPNGSDAATWEDWEKEMPIRST